MHLQFCLVVSALSIIDVSCQGKRMCTEVASSTIDRISRLGYTIYGSTYSLYMARVDHYIAGTLHLTDTVMYVIIVIFANLTRSRL